MRAVLFGIAAAVFTFFWLVSFSVIIWKLPLGDLGAIIVFGLTTLTIPLSLLAGLLVYRRASGSYDLEAEMNAARERRPGLDPTHHSNIPTNW